MIMIVVNTDLEACYYVSLSMLLCILEACYYVLFAYVSAAQAEAGLPSPSWLRNDDMARLTELAAFTLTIMFNSKGKKRLTAGKQRMSVIWYTSKRTQH